MRMLSRDSAILTDMRRFVLPSLVTIVLLCSGCPAKNGRSTLVSAPLQLTQVELAELQIPPTKQSLAVYRKLGLRADVGDLGAAWQRAHYLLDLFDAARFGDDAGSRELLGEIAGRPADAMRGPAATQAIAELLLVGIDHVLEIDRAHVLGGQARTLATFDALPPRNRREAFQKSQELKRILTRGDGLTANAQLRLFGYCRSALEDAAQARGRERRVALSHCLYPLYSSDPEPYFESDANLRPPPPSPGVLLEQAQTLLRDAPKGRLRRAIATQRVWAEAFASTAATMEALDPVTMRLAPAQIAPLYDDYPIIPMMVEELASRTAILQRELAADGRGIAALALASESAGATTLVAGEMAAAAGATELALLVSTEQSLRVPTGDYWSNRISSDTVRRIGAILVSLKLVGKIDVDVATQGVKATTWAPSRAALKLHLVVSPESWDLISPAGRVAKIDTSTAGAEHPRDRLRTSLTQIRRAFPDEGGLVLVPAGEVSYGALISAATAAAVDAQGAPLFPLLALAAAPPKAAKGTLLQARIARRSAARVDVNPSSLRFRLPVARSCYLELLDKSAKQTGTVRLTLGAEGNTLESSGPRALQACAEKAFGGTMIAQGIPAADLVFRLQAK